MSVMERVFKVVGLERGNLDMVRDKILGVDGVVSCSLTESGVCVIGMNRDVGTDELNRALGVLDGDLSLVRAESFVDDGSRFWQGWGIWGVLVVGFVIVVVLAVLVVWLG